MFGALINALFFIKMKNIMLINSSYRSPNYVDY